MKNRKGFSLVELVVAIAILSIVGTAVIGFCMAGTNSFKKVSNDVDLQYEAQLVVNQLENLLVDSDYGYNYQNDTLSIFNQNDSYEVIWDRTTNQLNLKKYYISDSNISEGPTDLMAENITSFSAVVKSDNNSSKQYMDVSLTLTRDGNSYSMSKSVTLRNQVKEFGSITDAYQDKTVCVVTGIELFYKSGADSIRVDANKIVGTRGGNIEFTANVLGDGGPSQDVIWSVSVVGGSNPIALPDTKIDKVDGKGIFHIADGEPATEFQITATSVANGSYSARAYVTLDDLYKFTGITIDNPVTELVKGQDYDFNATVHGDNLIGVHQEIVWSVKAVDGVLDGATIESSTGILSLGPNDPTTQVTVIAQAYYAPWLTTECTFTLVAPPKQFLTISIAETGENAGMTKYPGTDVVLTATIDGNSSLENEDKEAVLWTIDSGEASIKAGQGTKTVTISIPDDAKDGQITVRATAKNDTNENKLNSTYDIFYEVVEGAILLIDGNPVSSVDVEVDQEINLGLKLEGIRTPEVDLTKIQYSVSPNSYSVNNHKLSIGAAGTVTVSATYVYRGRTLTTPTVTINVVDKPSILIKYKDIDKTNDKIIDNISAGASLDISAEIVNGIHMTDKSLEWTVSGGSSTTNANYDSNTNKLTISSEEIASSIVLTFSSKEDTSISASVKILIAHPAAAKLRIYWEKSPGNKIDVTNSSFVFNRPGYWDDNPLYIKLTARYEGETNDTRVNWTRNDSTYNKKDDSSSWDIPVYKFDTEYTFVVSATKGSDVSKVTINLLRSGKSIQINSILGDDVVDCDPAKSYTYTANVEASQGISDKSVSWSLSGNNDTGTSINRETGVLIVAAEETATKLTITATSNYDISAFKTKDVEVKVKRVDLEIDKSLGSIYYGESKTLSLSKCVYYYLNEAEKGVKWEIVSDIDASSGVSIDDNGKLTVSSAPTVSSVTVKVSSKYGDGKYSDTHTIYIVKPDINIIVKSGEVVIDKSIDVYPSDTIEEDYSLPLSAIVYPDDLSNKSVSWELEGVGDSRIKLDDANTNSVKLTMPKSIADSGDVTITVKVSCTSYPDSYKRFTVVAKKSTINGLKVYIQANNKAPVEYDFSKPVYAVQGANIKFIAVIDGDGLTEEQQKSAHIESLSGNTQSIKPLTSLEVGTGRDANSAVLHISPKEQEHDITIVAMSNNLKYSKEIKISVQKLQLHYYANSDEAIYSDIFSISMPKGKDDKNAYYYFAFAPINAYYADTVDFHVPTEISVNGNKIYLEEYSGLQDKSINVIKVSANKDVKKNTQYSMDILVSGERVGGVTIKIEDVDRKILDEYDKDNNKLKSAISESFFEKLSKNEDARYDYIRSVHKAKDKNDKSRIFVSKN